MSLDSFVNIDRLQDIHISDESLWVEFKYYWDNGNYTKALEVINNNQQLLTKYTNAEWFNNLTNLIYELEILPNNFNKKKIVVSYLPPDLEVGDIWFQLEAEEVKINVYMNVIPPNSTSVMISYSNNLIEALAFKNNELVLTEQTIDEEDGTVTFSIGQATDKPIVCMVYSTNNASVLTSYNFASVGADNLQVSYSGTLLSAMLYKPINATFLNEKIITDLTIETSAIGFSMEESTTTAITGRTVYIPTNQLSSILSTSSSAFSTNSSTLVSDGYLVNSFIKNSSTKEVIVGDVCLDLQNTIINVPQNSGVALNCDIYYT